MSLPQRLKRLETTAASMNLQPPCTECGGARRDGKAFLVIPNAECVAGRCESCGLRTDLDGVPLGRLGAGGQVSLKILILDPDPSTVLP